MGNVRCPVCKRPVTGNADRCCDECAEKRRQTLARPAATPPAEGDEQPLIPPLGVVRREQYTIPASRSKRPHARGRRVFRNEKGSGG